MLKIFEQLFYSLAIKDIPAPTVISLPEQAFIHLIMDIDELCGNTENYSVYSDRVEILHQHGETVFLKVIDA